MSDVAIRVENLGKQYFIGQGKTARYETLSERLTGIITSPVRSIQSVLRGQSSAVATDSIWALQDVSFEVKHGEVIGIIGRNGAGKSTLLKILSQITEPTEGVIDIYGRVGALLEVGTGFHPELTGRENVYLNGAILGMKRKEIKCKFDEIVDFSGVERFIDTPVKHYSSGMQVRLAFAVAAHLEPEILIVDEVLAVGDAEFQKKCLGKMQDATGQGRTVLFVSHNMGSIEKLCTKAGCLEQGQLTLIDTPTNVIAAYLNNTSVNNYQSDNIQIQDRDIWIKQIVISQGQDKAAVYLDPRQPVEIHLTYEVLHPLDNLLLGFDVFSSDGTHLFRTYDLEGTGMQRDVGYYVSVLSLPAGVFQSTSYYLELLVGLHRIRWISRGKFAVKLDFREARMVDVTYPGALKTLGSWNVLMQEALP